MKALLDVLASDEDEVIALAGLVVRFKIVDARAAIDRMGRSELLDVLGLVENGDKAAPSPNENGLPLKLMFGELGVSNENP